MRPPAASTFTLLAIGTLTRMSFDRAAQSSDVGDTSTRSTLDIDQHGGVGRHTVEMDRPDETIFHLEHLERADAIADERGARAVTGDDARRCGRGEAAGARCERCHHRRELRDGVGVAGDGVGRSGRAHADRSVLQPTGRGEDDRSAVPDRQRTADSEHPGTGPLDPQRASVHREVTEGDDDPGRLDVLDDAQVAADERIDESIAHQHLPTRSDHLVGATNGAGRDGDADHDGRGTDDADESPVAAVDPTRPPPSA